MFACYKIVVALFGCRATVTPIATRNPENNMNWLQSAIDSLVGKLTFALELKGDKQAAIDYVKTQTTAGPKAWEMALEQLGW